MSRRHRSCRKFLAVYHYIWGISFLVFMQASIHEASAAQDHVLGSSTLESVDDFQAGAGEIDRDVMPGAALFNSHCKSCHNGSVPKAPHQQWLEMMSAQSLDSTINEGIMAAQAKHLSVEEKQQIISYLTFGVEQVSLDDQYPPTCGEQEAGFDLQDQPPKNNWGHSTSRYVMADLAGLSAEEVPNLHLKWAYAYPGANRARSQPAVGWGSIFVGSQDGKVYALDLETGCERWRFQASAEVRTGIVLNDGKSGRRLAFFGDILAKAYAVDALTGELVWQRRADDHPSATLTGTPALSNGVLYVPVSSLEVIPAADPAYACCTFRGKILAIHAETGEEVWTAWAIPEPSRSVGKTSVGTEVFAPSGAPIWSSPLIDEKRGVLYAGTGENYSSPADDSSDAIHAFKLLDGKLLWKRQTLSSDAWNVACMMQDHPNCPKENGPDMDYASSVVMVTDTVSGKDILVAGQKSGMLHGLDPDDSGKILWAKRVGRGGIQGGVHFGMAAERHRVYVPIADNGELPPNSNYSGPAQAGMHLVDGRNGEILWRHLQADVCGEDRPYCAPGISAAVTAFPGYVVAGHLDGHLRIYSAVDGTVVWDYDTTAEFKSVSGHAARGGSMSGGGPVLHKGHLIVNSGYGLYFHEPGNVLLVFSDDKR